MKNEWLKPSLEKRTNEIIGSFLDNISTNETHEKLNVILNDLNDRFNIGPIFLKLENLFYMISAISIEHSYGLGFEDAINLCRCKKRNPF